MIGRAIQLILVYRHLGHIGDHASNIAENAVNVVQKRIVRHKRKNKTRNPNGQSISNSVCEPSGQLDSTALFVFGVVAVLL